MGETRSVTGPAVGAGVGRRVQGPRVAAEVGRRVQGATVFLEHTFQGIERGEETLV